MDETSYLLSTPANREWLIESLSQAASGDLQTFEFPITIDSTSNEE
jgi:PHD/YefM family antitoxin component YafN of YafNO toxin-antitoxin module